MVGVTVLKVFSAKIFSVTFTKHFEVQLAYEIREMCTFTLVSLEKQNKSELNLGLLVTSLPVPNFQLEVVRAS